MLVIGNIARLLSAKYPTKYCATLQKTGTIQTPCVWGSSGSNWEGRPTLREQPSLRDPNPVCRQRLDALAINRGRIALSIFNPKLRQKERIYYVLRTKQRFIIV